jgi:hypothetical protein
MGFPYVTTILLLLTAPLILSPEGVTYDDITSSHGVFFVRYQFEQEGMHQIIVRINTKNGGVGIYAVRILKILVTFKQ